MKYFKIKNLVLIIIFLFVGYCKVCSQHATNENYLLLKVENFQKKVNDKNVSLYFLKNGNISMAITNYGARIVSLCVPDKNGEIADVVIGFKSIDEYMKATGVYHGAIIGRVAGRIKKGMVNLNGDTYPLQLNNGSNHLHGGSNGFHNQVWTVNSYQANQLVLSYLSKDGEEGYPGNLSVKVTYKLTNDNELKIDYEATSDKTTVVNLTNHAYFNLNGQGDSTITDHELNIFASNFSAVDRTLIPVGEPVSVKGTPFDFTNPKLIGKDIAADHIQIKNGLGYDHNFVLDKKSADDMVKAAVVYSPLTGITMEVLTTEPAIQFYSGNFLDGSLAGKKGKKYLYRSAFCLETQHYPDAPNQLEFPSTQLEPGKKYQTATIYKFGIKNN